MKERSAVLLDLDAIAAGPLARAPFPYTTASGVIGREGLDALDRDFPPIERPGIFPLSSLRYGPAFAQLVDEIGGSQMQAVIEQKFAVDLSDRPLMITVRGQCQARDGQIHTDSLDKIVTCLLYLNRPSWDDDGGRLRLLRDGADIESAIAEVAPTGGTFVAFRRTANSWHGHKPFVGPRRYVMFNWLRSEAALAKNVARHALSAMVKHLGRRPQKDAERD